MTAQHALLEALEPRILYSADLAAVLGSAVDSSTAAAHVQLLQTAQPAGSAQEAAQESAKSTRLEIAFIDLAIPDAQALIAGLAAQRDAGRALEMVTIAADEDGLALISHTLQQRQDLGQDISAVHLFSHGSAGQVQLGGVTLDQNSAVQRAQEVAAWGSALTADADLLIYGCDVASTGAGQELLATLAALTGADAAASTDATGAAQRGGNWLLEVSSGAIETPVAVGAELQQSWTGLLGTEFQVNSTQGDDQTTAALTRGSQQAVALDAAGNFVVVWSSRDQDGNGYGVYARRFAWDGTPLSAEIQVSATTTGDQNQARVVSDTAGNFVVVWSSNLGGGSNGDIFMRRFDANGSALTTELLVNTFVNGDQINPVVAMDRSSGAFVVVWEGEGSGDSRGIYFRRYSANATALDAASRQANTSDGGNEANPAVAMDSTGRFVIAYDVGTHMYFQRFDATGLAQGGRTQVDNLLSNSTGASIAMDDAGNFTLAYREVGILAPGVWGRGYLADGSQRYTWYQADSGDATSPSIAMASDGAFVVTYQKTGADGTDILARKYNANGSANGAAFAVSAYTTGAQAAPSVALQSKDDFVVVWSGKSASDAMGVVARTFGTPAAPPVITSNGGGATAAISVAENSTAVTTVTANDANATTPTFSLAGGADVARFSINATTGALVFVSAPDFEAPADGDANNVYEVIVRASDGALTDNQTIAVTVTDVGNQLTVTTTADVLDGNTASVEALVLNPGADGLISLREAISAANSSTTGPVTIVLGAGSYLIGIAAVGASDNNADGDFDIMSTLTITGASTSSSVIDAQALDRVLHLHGSANLTLNNLTVRGGQLASNQYGAAAYLDAGTSLTLTGVVVTANHAGSGGAIYNYQGALSFTDSTLSNNVADNWGGAIYNDRGAITLLRSTFSGNASGRDGGAINNAGAGASLALVNTTFSGNSATDLGGAIFSNRALTVLNSTIALNTSGTGAAGLHLQGAASAQLQNTLLYNPAGSNSSKPVVSLGNNFDSDGSAAMLGAGDLSGTTTAPLDPRLGLLQNNGGATATHALLIGSAALDAGNTAAAPATDQRGSARVAAADIGAYEAPNFINRAPQNLLPGSLAVLEDAISPVTGLSVSDADETTGQAQNRLGTTALSVLNGRLLVTLTGGATITGGANGSLALTLTGSEASLNATLATLSYQATANYVGGDTLTVLSRDGGSLPDTDSLPITVAAVNDAPSGTNATLTMAAGSQQTLSSAGFGFADASGESDSLAAVLVQLPSAGTLVLNGTALSAATEVSLAQLDAGLLRFVPAPTASGSGYATLDFRVRDNGGTANGGIDLDPTAATLTFNIANGAPQIYGPVNAASASLTQAENRLPVVTIAATDPDSADTVSYRIAGGADAARFVIDGSSGALRFAVAPDFENPQDADTNNIYEVQVRASDGLLDDTLSLTVQVTDVGNRAVVTTTADVADGDLSSIEALTTNPGADGKVSLREALMAANNTPGLDTVAFSISAPLVAGAHTVQLSSALPDLTSPVIIDGRSEADFGGTPVVELLGQGLWSNGLRLGAGSGGSTVQALALSGFTGDAIQVQGSQGHRFLGNHIGTDVTGRMLRSNGGAGIAADGSNLVIGGVGAGDANVIAGSGSAAISLGGGAANIVISGNLVGVGSGGEVLGNTRGIDLGTGVRDVRIGGTAAGAGNVIAYSSQNAIRLASSAGTGNHWLGNTLRDNTGLAIDVGGDGVTANDSNDVDTGPNRLQNHPLLASALARGADTVVAGVLDSNANTNYRIEFYAAAAAHSSGYGPGTVWLGAASVSTDTAGHADFDVVFSGIVSTAGQVISAVAVVDLGGGNFGDASELGPAQTVTAVNVAPQIVSDGAAAQAALAVAENSTAVTTVLALDSNRPAQMLVFSIAGGADAARFTLHPTTGLLAFDAAPNFETPGDSDADGVYVVLVQVSDGSLADTQLISVTVTDNNEFAVSAPRDVDAQPNSVAENTPPGTAVGLQAAAQDLDGGNHDVSFVLDDSAGGRFSIDASSGVVRVAGILDAEAASTHIVTVRAVSSDGSWRLGSFDIGVQDSNEYSLGAVGDSDTATNRVPETAAAGSAVGLTANAVDADLSANTVTYTLADDASGRFAIDTLSGSVTLARMLGEEGLTSHSVKVLARSSDGSFSTQAFTVGVDLVNNHAPLITSLGGAASAAVSIDEGQLRVGTVTASDADLPARPLLYRLSGGADTALFHIDSASGVLSFVSAADFEQPGDSDGNGVYEVTVAATDGALQAQQILSVQLRNVDEAPRWLGNSLSNTLIVSESGSAVPGLLMADEDTLPALLRLQVLNLSGGHFELLTAPGTAVMVFTQADVAAGRLHFVTDGGELAPGYQLMLSDGTTTLPALTAVVTFTPINDAPVFTSVAALSLPENSTAVTQVTASDVDTVATSLRYSLAAGADGQLFSINSVTGSLFFNSAPDFEHPQDANRDGRYELVLAVSDGISTAQQGMTVTVLDVDEAPSVTHQSLTLSDQGATLDLRASDPEGRTSTLAYEVLSTQGGHFVWQAGAATPGSLSTLFTQADVDANRVRFVADTGAGSGTGAGTAFMLALNDGAHRVILAAPLIVRLPPTAVATAAPQPAAAADPEWTAAPAESTTAVSEVPAAPVSMAPNTPRAASAVSAAAEAAPAPAVETRRIVAAESAEPLSSHAAPAQPTAPSNPTTSQDAADFWASALAGLTLPTADAAPLRDPAAADFSGSRNNTLMAQAMDAARVRSEEGLARIEMGSAGTVLVSSGLSVGYVLWLARGGVLVASLMSSVPAWASVDPLPVLSQMRKRGAGADGTSDDDGDHDHDPIERLFSRARRLIPGAPPIPPAQTAVPAPAPAAQSPPARVESSLSATRPQQQQQREATAWAS